MRKILKFRLNIENEQEVTLPFGAKILSVGEQFGDVFLWASTKIDEVDGVLDGYTTLNRKIFIFGTGHDLPEDIHKYEFLGTVMTDGGNYVWHIFDGGVNPLTLRSASLYFAKGGS